MSTTESTIIREGSIEEVVNLSKKIPEFINPHGEQEYRHRLNGKSFLILVAEQQGELAGFKVGYEKENDESFYSWMGAVLPDFRRLGIAKKLAIHQEEWAKNQGYKCIRFKTRNNLKDMLIFGVKNGFNIIAVENRSEIKENRILLEKSLYE